MKNPNSTNSQEQNRVLVDVSELMIGMYVCALDKPWKDSSFIFQGFLIQNQDILQQVKNECDYVYVDIAKRSTVNFVKINSSAKSTSSTRSTRNISSVKLLKSNKKKQSTAKKSSFVKSISSKVKSKFSKKQHHLNLAKFLESNISPEEIKPPEKIKSFEDEIDVAQKAHLKARQIIQSYINDVEKGEPININIANKAVKACMHSILRTPDAMMLMTHLQSKDKKIWGHSMNTCVLAITFGRYLNLPNDELMTLGLCGLLHDIGNLVIPTEVLNKTSELNPKEEKILQSHTSLGKKILSPYLGEREEMAELLKSEYINFEKIGLMRSFSPMNEDSQSINPVIKQASIISNVAQNHHERVDGKGYPRGISSSKLSAYTKMISIIDTYDELTTDTKTGQGKTHFEAIDIIRNKINTHFDETLVNCFIQSIGSYPAGSVVEMNTGEIAMVIEVNQQLRLRPKVILLTDKSKVPAPKKMVNLAHIDENDWAEHYSIKNFVHPDTCEFEINQYYNYGVIQKRMANAA